MNSRMKLKLILSFYLFILLKRNISINNIIKFYERNRKNISYIPVSFSADNNYLYPLIVLLTSILVNANPKTFYLFYIMIPYNFRWPLEKICIKDAYLQFNNWGIKLIEDTDWYKYPIEELVY